MKVECKRDERAVSKNKEGKTIDDACKKTQNVESNEGGVDGGWCGPNAALRRGKVVRA